MMTCMIFRNLNVKREGKVSRLMGRVKGRGLGRRMRAGRAGSVTRTGTGSQRWT